jgi:hypothetical protein
MDHCRDSAERREWHERKMASKVERPLAQLAPLGIKPGRVAHINLRAGVTARPATPGQVFEVTLYDDVADA